jgi:hypothetical protein
VVASWQGARPGTASTRSRSVEAGPHWKPSRGSMLGRVRYATDPSANRCKAAAGKAVSPVSR